MFFRRKLACSFCGKGAARVAKLVAGRRAYICDTCTAEALRLMSDSGEAKSGSAASPRKNLLADLWRCLVRRSHRDRESMSMESA
jgi:ATP-dependent protease Clp ATPase subunit